MAVQFKFRGHEILVRRDGDTIMFSIDGGPLKFLSYAEPGMTRSEAKRRVVQRLRDFPAHLAGPPEK